ncbi:hypothetical protein ACH5RR_041222 [Cinchona calisaya]|uniref:Uncharacterized protein n=1 Tax=Cinchona calisaya TaxID=153742 RepID=A0ABD2XYD1_9GENT
MTADDEWILALGYIYISQNGKPDFFIELVGAMEVITKMVRREYRERKRGIAGEGGDWVRRAGDRREAVEREIGIEALGLK